MISFSVIYVWRMLNIVVICVYIFSTSGIFNYAQDIFKTSIKASFTLTKSIISGEPSINTSLHLYDHLIKPIVLYGAEIRGVLKTNCAACKKHSAFSFKDTRVMWQKNLKSGI